MTDKNSTGDEEGLEDWQDSPEPYKPEDKQAKKKRRACDITTSFDIKYRPEDLSEIAGQTHLKQTLCDLVRKGKIGHMIFTGPPGVGKTSTAVALAHELFGPHWEYNFKEFNVPAGNNNLKFINDELRRYLGGQPIQATFRIAFLDECEDLTPEAQSALRKYLEDTRYKKCKLIFATNHHEKLLPQLQGERITVLHFKPIPKKIVEAKLKVICDYEGIICEGDVLKIIAENSNGSLRKGIRDLDFFCDHNKHISLQKVKDLISYVEPSDVKELLRKAIYDEEYVMCLEQLNIEMGVPIPKILQEVLNVIDDMKLEPNEKRYVIDQLGLYSWRISQSSDHMLQMRCFLNSLANVPKA